MYKNIYVSSVVKNDNASGINFKNNCNTPVKVKLKQHFMHFVLI